MQTLKTLDLFLLLNILWPMFVNLKLFFMLLGRGYSREQRRRIAELYMMGSEQWDTLCKRCGVCCLMKFGPNSKTTFFTDLCCSHFDCQTRQCNVYKNRLVICRDTCKKIDLSVVLDGQMLPRSCGYVEYIFGPSQNPVNIDFKRVRPLPDHEFENMRPRQLFAHAIPGSIKWNQRPKQK